MSIEDSQIIEHCMQMLSDLVSLACGELDDCTVAEAVKQARESIRDVRPALARFERENRNR